MLVAYYGIATIITFGLLCLPWIKLPDAPETTLLDNLFMAISTISVTGLSTFPIDQVYNEYGVILLEILFQVGGFGVTMLATVAMVLTGRRIGLHQRQLIQFDMNQPRLSGMVKLVTSVFGLMIMVQVVFGLLFSLYFTWRHVYDNFSLLFSMECISRSVRSPTLALMSLGTRSHRLDRIMFFDDHYGLSHHRKYRLPSLD